MPYKIIEGNSPSDVERKVNSALSEGWKLAGNLIAVPTIYDDPQMIYLQPMRWVDKE